ncbi:MAG: hypothetical protein HY722_16115 [Planctomycetes bacterium]|nr:hypothetical protein [Planctomycetota bacterium]
MRRHLIIMVAVVGLAWPPPRAASAPLEACCVDEMQSPAGDPGPGPCCPDGCGDCSRPCCGGARVAALDAPPAPEPMVSTPLAPRPSTGAPRVSPPSIFRPPPVQ